MHVGNFVSGIKSITKAKTGNINKSSNHINSESSFRLKTCRSTETNNSASKSKIYKP